MYADAYFFGGIGMKRVKSILSYFSILDLSLWGSSIILILFSFFCFDGSRYLTLAASLIGVTSLIFNAKGNPVGQALIILFSVLYGVISFTVAYYGEMITYLGMTAPMAVVALYSWLRNPYQGRRSEVTVNSLKRQEVYFMLGLTLLVTIAFYFILEAFHTANLLVSTISVTTTFIAVYLTFRRSPYFTLAYAANDLVLIFLWSMAAVSDVTCISVVVCFVVFFVNDLYGLFNWKKMQVRQQQEA